MFLNRDNTSLDESRATNHDFPCSRESALNQDYDSGISAGVARGKCCFLGSEIILVKARSHQIVPLSWLGSPDTKVHAGPGQLRIRVHAATVNPTDILDRNGTRAEQQKADPPPYVPGMDVAGIVDELEPAFPLG